MVPASLIEELELAQRQRIRSALIGSLPWLVFTLALVAMGIFDAVSSGWMVGGVSVAYILLGVSGIPAIVTLKYLYDFYRQRKILAESREVGDELRAAGGSSSIQAIQRVIGFARDKSNTQPLVKARLEDSLPALEARLRMLRKDEAYATVHATAENAVHNIGPFLKEAQNNLPVFRAQARIRESLEFLERRRKELKQQWEAAFNDFSWWNKLKYGAGPNFSDLDRMLRNLRRMDRELSRRHGDEIVVILKHFKALKEQAINRIDEARRSAEAFIEASDGESAITSDVLRKSAWLSMLSIPVSAWTDVDRAADVFEAVRSVSGHFSDMSDAEIWWETLFLPSESLAGLAALTKGAYFEQLVAADTGGELHEHFNTADTDIVIDGTAFQIKATDSESYIDSVADGIPVISTSEAALFADSIDSGYSNEELNDAVNLALGGTVVDVGDTTVDAILTGVGGLGFFPTLQGLNHAVEKHENGGDGVEAAFEGAGIAIEGSARAFVGVAEMGYKGLSSRPSRFVGRGVLSGLKWLDKKLFEPPERR